MKEVDEYVQKFGRDKVLDTLKVLDADPADTLTIIGNDAQHHIPRQFLRGQVIVAYSGSMKFSPASEITAGYIQMLKTIVPVLKQKQWKRIYLIPMGHCSVSMILKSVVQRITSIDTIDVIHVGEGEYFELEMNLREVISNI